MTSTLLRAIAATCFVGLALAGVAPACDASPEAHWPELDASPADYAACAMPGECLALVPGCCSICGTPKLADVVGVNADQVDAFRAATCTRDASCPECPETADPNLVAFCESDRCAPRDLRLDPMSACVRDEDCTLRYADCCEPCTEQPASLVALAKLYTALYADEVCRPKQSCPACAVAYPPGWSSTCGGDGHCHVVSPASDP